jgi:hypothetical protein
MRHLILALCCAATAGCANWGYNPTYRFNEIQAVNLAGAAISDVRVVVLGTDKSVSCDSVNPSAMCHDRFGSRRYPAAGIELSWIHADGSRKSETMNPHIPVYYSATFPLRIVMEINPDGSVKSFYEQEEPGDGPMFDS